MKKDLEQIAKLEAKSKANIEKLEGKLTKKELRYWKIVKPNSGVLFLKGAPGTSKSAIAKSIATKLNLRFWDLRLSQMDAVDLGSYPYPLKNEAGEPFLTQLNPDWMLEAANNGLEDNNGWLVFYDELNRAPLEVRNAALRILLERTSNNLEFPQHVYQMAAGNLGSEDGTQVEELDGALRSRLITMTHDITLPEWIQAFAKENVHPYVVRFLEAKPASFVSSDVDASVIANARTWTFVSDYIIANFGMESTPGDFIKDMNEICRAYVGNESIKFIRWCEDNMKLTLADVLKSTQAALPGKLKKVTKLGLTELLTDLKEKDLTKLTDKQYKNAVTLIRACQDETIVEYISHIGQTIDQKIIIDRKSRYNDLLRIQLEKWKDMVMEKAD
jgi:hypothetical protein